MAKTNFQIFNEENTPERTYNDSEYKEATQRLGGVMPGMALSRMHNKMYYQWSSMCKAIANLIVNHGHDCMDNDVEGITRYLEESITSAAADASINIIQRNKSYAVGDIAYSKNLPSWARLECVKAGTTAAEEPVALASVSTGGVLLSDGSVLWIIDDIRDGTPVGAVRGSLYLPPGYIKANGATVQRADYPRLVALVEAHNLWTDDTAANAGLFGRGDGAATMVLPNWVDRMVQLAGDGIGASVVAGLPDINGWLWAGHNSGFTPTPTNPFTTENIHNGVNYTQGAYGGHHKWHFDASRSSPIYGAAATVQPAAIKLIPIIRY